jgi:hypothetical protein
MNSPCSFFHWSACFVTMFYIFGLIGAVTLGEGVGAPVEKPDPKKMVDAIVNRNQPPKLKSRRGLPKRVALYPDDYDWKEEERVRQAIDKLYQGGSPELWEELVRREDDSSYCVVLVEEQTEDAKIRSVGAICYRLASSRLTGVYQQHMPKDDVTGRWIHVDLGIPKLNEWRKERATTSLYQLQIEVCEKAIRELSKEKRVTQVDKDLAREKIEAEIKKLRETKQPVMVNVSFPSDLLYTEKVAKWVREAVKNNSDEEIRIAR